MKHFLISQYRRYRQIFLYGVIGFSGAILDFFLYALLALSWGVAPWLATVVSSFAGACNNYVLNARYNFRTNDRHAYRFAAYYGVSIVGVGANSLGVYVLYSMVGTGVMTSKVLIAIPVVLCQYLLNSRYTFAELETKS